MEDYYLGAPEARGEWIGSAARELGLSGAVEADELRRCSRGWIRATARRCGGSASRVRVAGFDLTFSAPKSVSVLFGVGDEALRGRVRAAHDRAVREALGYLERSAAAVRRGRGGAVVEEASGLVAAGVPASDVSRRRSAAAHARARREPRSRARRPLVGARRSAAVRARADGELRLPGGAAGRADAHGSVSSGRPCATGSPRSSASRSRCGRRSAGGGRTSRRRSRSRGSSGPRAAEAAALATRRRQGRRSLSAEALVAEWRARAQRARLRRRGAARGDSAGRDRDRARRRSSRRLWRELWPGRSG